MGNGIIQETQMVSGVLDHIAALLPTSWRLVTRSKEASDGRRDLVVELIGPSDAVVSYIVEAKRSGAVSVSLLMSALRELHRTRGMPVLFVSDYIGPTLRANLASEGFSFADATGWVRVTSVEAPVLLTGQGAASSPRARKTSAVARLDGVAASRIIRALAAVELPVGVRSLAGVAASSPGSVSKLLVTLASEGIIDRNDNGSVVTVRPRALLRRWVVDYSFGKANPSVGYFIAPRGLDRALVRLGDQSGVAVTGSAAARRLLPDSSTSVVPLRLLAIYAARPADLAGELGLIDAEPASANVVIARPQDAGILSSIDEGDLATAPLPLVIADLLTLPGRSDAEAEQLLDAMATVDEAWKE